MIIWVTRIEKKLHFDIKKKFFFICGEVVSIDFVLSKNFLCGFKKTQFSKIKDLIQKNKNTVTLGYVWSCPKKNLVTVK